MANVFNAGEVFGIGIQIEKNGKSFYSAAAAKTDNPSNKELFSKLADWEGEHVTFFENLRDSLPEGARQEIEYDPDNMVHLYLKSLADSMVFSSGTKTGLEGLDSYCDIIKKALEMEKESVVVYTSMKEIVPENMGKSEIDKLIKEEIKHIGQLTKALNKK